MAPLPLLLLMNPLLVFVFQHALRLLAFGQIYKVLEMDPLPSSKPSQKYLWSEKEGTSLSDSLSDSLSIWVS